MAQMKNTVRVDIDSRIKCLPAEPVSWLRIFKVPHYLRKLNEEAYEPRIISIGPYHRQNDHLKAMETLKVRFLKDLLRRRKQNSAERYVEAMTSIMVKARSCYAESLVISDEEFLEMMVLDGCFIVELIQKFAEGSWHDPSSNVSRIFEYILQDLMLVENQLPFFVLCELYGKRIEDQRPFIYFIIKMFEDKMPGLRVRATYDENSIKRVKHLLHLLHTNWLPSEDLLREYQKTPKNSEWHFIRSATELREAGIRFKRGKGCNLFDIKFENGTLEIPAVTIEDATEILNRNVIACEQSDNSGSPTYLTDYRKVMDCLINTGKDVELLCRSGIIDNCLGTDEAVAVMINRIGTDVLLDRNFFFYARLFNEVNKHYYTPWNRRLASLRHDYFNTPWAFVSFLAATFLLIVSTLQTIFTIFPRS